MIQTLYLLRHARSEPWSPGIDDFGRALNRQGTDDMQRLSVWIQQHLAPPNVVLCSTSRRTRETLDVAWPEMRNKAAYTDDIYEASTGRLHALLEKTFEDAGCVMVVGHNPGLETLAMAVLKDAEDGDFDGMSPGTLAVIEFQNGYAQDAGQGRLRHWVHRKQLSAK